MADELLPKPQNDLPLPEKEIPAETGLAFQGVSLEGYGRKFPFPKFVLLGIVFIVLLGIIGGAYFLGRNSVFKELNPSNPVPPPADPVVYQPTPTPDPTADWKTFTNNDLGFSIKYPSSYSLKNYDSKSGGIYLGPNEILTNSKPLDVDYSVAVASAPNDQNLSLSDPKEMFGKGPLIFYEPTLLKEIPVNKTTLDGQEAYRINDCCGGQAGTEADILTIRDGRVFQILVAPYQTSGDENKNKQLYEQIISTFKFTDATGTSCGSKTLVDDDGTGGCPGGYVCSYKGDYPDRTGTCIKQ